MSESAQKVDSLEIVRKPVGAGEQKEGSRELLFSVSPGKKMVWLKLRDREFAWNNLPLGTVEPEKKGEVTKGANVLVPVVPLRYTTAECDEEEADKLRCGWVYVFRREAGEEGPLQLWRELAVDDAGYFSDVHLKKMEGRDVRRATGFADNRILLPYKVFNVEQEIYMAYSEVQWNWARVQKVAEDAELQGQRLQRIPLAGYENNFVRNTPAGNDAVVKTVEEAPQLYHLSLLRKEKVPVVYLHDPLGVALALHSVFFKAFEDAARFLEKNARGKVISDIADAILDAKPQYAEQLREEERQSFKADYRSQGKQFEEAYEKGSRNFLDYMKRTSSDSGPTVASAFSDFDLKLIHHRNNLEQIMAVLLTNVAVTENGRKYIVNQLEGDESLLNQILAFKDKAKDATDAIFNAVAAQLATIEGKWSVLAAFVQRRYLLEISRTEMSLVEFLGSGQILNSKIMQRAMNVSVVETATIAMRYEPPRVTGITIAGHNLSAYAKKIANNVHYAGIMLGLEAYNLVSVLKEYGNQKDKFDPWVLSQLLVNFGASAAGTTSATLGFYSADLARKGLEEASKAAGRAAMKAGMVAAFIGAVYEVTQAVEESQSGDTDAATSHGVMAGGALASGIGSILLLTATVSNPIGWAVVIGGILVSVGGAISLLWTDNSPIEDWLLHSHWGAMSYAGKNEEEGRDGKKYLLDYTDWENDPKAELDAYYHIIYGFKASTSWKKVTPSENVSCLVSEKQFVEFELLVEVPNYDPKRSRIACELKFQVGEVSGPWHYLISKDQWEPPHRRYGKASEPRKIVWDFKRNQIPKGAKRAEATVWYDPFGDGSKLLPNEFGLKVETRRHESNAKEG